MASVVRSVRIPTELSQRIDAAAEKLNVSANSLMVVALQSIDDPGPPAKPISDPTSYAAHAAKIVNGHGKPKSLPKPKPFVSRLKGEWKAP